MTTPAGAGPVVGASGELSGALSDELFDALFDDAALFPPARLPVQDAVPGHLVHRMSGHAALVGPFVSGTRQLSEVRDAVAGRGVERFAVSLTGTVEALSVAVRAVPSPLALVSVEAAGPLDAVLHLLDEVPVAGYAEVALAGRTPARVADDVAALADAGRHAKFRTGGTTAEAFPAEADLAAGIVACVAHGVAFKLTAGLHDPARHRDPATGFEHHGLLNVISATHAAIGGAPVGEVSGALADHDETRVAALVAALPPDDVAAVRRRFLSVGTCSIDECVTGLERVGLLPA